MEYTRLLKKGMSGEDVLYIKKCIFELGYFPSTVKKISSSTFGSDTDKAVKNFQKVNKDANGKKLVVDGKIGSLTWNAIVKLIKKPLLEEYKWISKEHRTAIEKELNNVSDTRLKICLEVLKYAYDYAAGGNLRGLYIIGADLYNTSKELFHPTISYIEARAKAKPTYFDNGRKEWMIEQIKKNPNLPASDCSGQEIGYMRLFGINSKDATANTLASATYSKAIKRSELKPGDWVAKDGHIGTYVGGGLVVEWYGGAYTCQLTDVDNRMGWNFMTQKLEKGSAWTKFRRPNAY